MNAQITMDKQWETQDHRKVRLVGIDKNPADAYPVIGFCYSPQANGSEYLQRWNVFGLALYKEEDQNCNLVPVPVEHEGWLTISREALEASEKVSREEAEERMSHYNDALHVLLVHAKWKA